MNVEDLLAPHPVRALDRHAPVEAAGAEQCGVEDIGPVRGRQDNHRLARIETALPKGAASIPGVIVPRKVVTEMYRLIEGKDDDISLSLSESKIRAEFDGAVLTSKLIDGTFPDYQRVITPEARTRFEQYWNAKLDPQPGLTVVEIMHAAAARNIRGMYIMGENPAMSDPDAEHARAAMAKLEHLVVQDIFLTETAQLA